MEVFSFPPQRPIDLIGMGRLCIDLNANEIHRPMEETISFTKYVGGSPANITIAAVKLGLNTGFIGRVSDDSFGRFIVQSLNAWQVDTSQIVIDRSQSVTGLAFTEIKSPTECSILMYRDNVADLKLEPNDVNEQFIKQAKAILLSGTALSKSPSREAVFRALEWARKHGTIVIFDIDYRPYSWNSRDEVSTYCRLVAEKSDIILGGREEFELLDSDAALVKQMDDRTLANCRFNHDTKLIVVKHGDQGSIAFTKEGVTCQVGIYPAQVVKTFGAGDSFAGAFIFSLMQGYDLELCLHYGSAAASIVVSSHSCSDAMPTVEQIRAVIDKYPIMRSQ